MRRRRYRPSYYAAVLLAVTIAISSSTAAQQAPENSPEATESAGAAVLDEVWRLVRDDFFDPNLRGIDWEAARKRQDAGLAAAKTSADVSASINRMLGELETSHTAHFTPSDVAYYHLLDIFARSRRLRDRIPEIFPSRKAVHYAGLGAFFRRIDDRVFVAGVWEASNATRAGLRVGDEIVSADGAPFAPIESFRNKAGQTVSLSVRRQSGGLPEAVSAQVEIIKPKAALLDAMRRSVRVIEAGERKIGYIRIWSYAGDEYHELLIDELANGPLAEADALLIDLRDGWGGATPDYLAPFLPGPSMRMTDRDGDARAVEFKWRKPVGLLINGGTRSGKEVLAQAFRDYDIGPVVGERTTGAVVAGTVYLLSDDSLLYLAVADVEVDGERIEGVGVAPTIEVPFDIRYAGGADPQLDRAVDEIARRVGGG